MPGIPIPGLCALQPPGARPSGGRNQGGGPLWSLRREGVLGSHSLTLELLNAARSSSDQTRSHPSLLGAQRLVGKITH